MQSKTELEFLLKECVDKIKAEKKKQPAKIGKFLITAQGEEDPNELNQAEREKVIEMLLSQEKVISLLYEKTFKMGAGSPDDIDQQVQDE